MSRRALSLALLGLTAFGLRLAPAALDAPARQVTIFGIVADPDDPAVDPKIALIAPQLRKLRPDHGFRLWGVQSRRLEPGGASMTCPLREGLTAEAQLLDGVEAGGKVRIRFVLRDGDRVAFTTTVTTPPNQLFFCEKPLDDGERLLIGIGAR